ncbi:MAG: BolA/IbaG family iron-sulfur metabolism protein [Gammaproteobacteria bacterium]|jgi:acid stress-induced BolA-like protein IbaG/YrbA|nr:BolA/IbaG family iron-sulfur metabolism protein [Gammaproteobacteria bacterium]MCH1551473.1 BolA/IbaG family iron-sulfur metabolism protein [Pseudomonadales bacterium]
MLQEELLEKITDALPVESINVQLDGNRAVIELVSERFVGLSRVKKQQAVYACIQEFIADGRLHAVTIKAHAP